MKPDGASLHRQLQVMTLALLSGMLLFGAVVAGLSLSGATAPAPAQPLLRIGAAVAGLLLLVTAQVVGPLMSRTTAHATAPEVARSLWTGVVVAMALREGAGLLGGVVGFVTGDLLVMTALLVAAVVTMLLGVPGREEIERRLRNARGG